MGTVYATYEAQIRQILGDTLNPPLLPSADLDVHVDSAARDLSLVSPITKLIAVTSGSNTRAIDLTSAIAGLGANLIRVLAVEWPTAQFPVNWVQWMLFGNSLTLLVATPPASPQTVNVYGLVGMVAGSSSGASTIPGAYDDLIVRRAAAYACQELAARLMNLVDVGGATTANQQVWEHYLTLGDALLKSSDAHLTLLGTRPLYFAGRLHAPMLPPQGWNQVNANSSEEVYP